VTYFAALVIMVIIEKSLQDWKLFAKISHDLPGKPGAAARLDDQLAIYIACNNHYKLT
jgi:hypothetical protein